MLWFSYANSLLNHFLPFFFSQKSNLDYVNTLIGNTGPHPNLAGGTIPSVGPPFGKTRWVAQTQPNYVSQTPYNATTSDIVYGFVGTRQPAIWMGESGPLTVVPGFARTEQGISAKWNQRGLNKNTNSEKFDVACYQVGLRAQEGEVDVLMSASSHVGYFTFTFSSSSSLPHIIIQASRPSTIYTVSSPNPSLRTDKTIPYFPTGFVSVNSSSNEICGWSDERQDALITPISIQETANGFKGYFCAHFDTPFESFGVIRGSEGSRQTDLGLEGTDGENETVLSGDDSAEGKLVSAYARFALPKWETKMEVKMRIATSFISLEQARENLLASPSSIDEVVRETEGAWEDEIGTRFEVSSDVPKSKKTVFYTAVYHALQFPYETSEHGRYWSGYDNKVHDGVSYDGYSIWDIYRAQWSLLILLTPSRIPGMIQSMIQDYEQGGWLPMWKNVVETNIMIATHADSLIAEAVVKGFRHGFDLEKAWEAVWKDVSVEPREDTKTRYYDRQEGVDFEARAGLVSYAKRGYVSEDISDESVSRTMGYAYDDYAAAKLAEALSLLSNTSTFLLNRSVSVPYTLLNPATGFFQARNSDGSWADESRGWTEGDKWAYTFDVVHDVEGLIRKRAGGSKEKFIRMLDEHFDGGHNDHTNEPSHHIPYLYALAGRPDKTQEKVREIAERDYNDTAMGLSGNEDCGQMSAWYIFSAMGFYPLNPVSGEYIVGSPFFDKLKLHLPIPSFSSPNASSPYYDPKTNTYTLTITAPGASSKNLKYVKSLRVNGDVWTSPVIKHDDVFIQGGNVEFEMSAKKESWGNVEHVEKRDEL